MEAIYQFFNHPVFVIFGGISVILVIVGVLLNLICWILGIAPLLWRLGYGRWYRKIAIVAEEPYFSNLKNDLLDSGIFRENKISQISCQSLSKVREQYLLLVHYQSFKEENIREILANKISKAGLIIYYPEYFPQGGKIIPDEIIKLINSKENTTIVNFRGRLLNDIITTLITTSYEKK